MYPWISRTLDFGLQLIEKMCGLYMDVYGIYLSSAANLVDVERVLSEKLRIRLCLFFLLVKMADRGHSKTNIFFLSIKPKIF